MLLVILGLLALGLVVLGILIRVLRALRGFASFGGSMSGGTAGAQSSLANDRVLRFMDAQLARTRADLASREARERQRLAAHNQETMRRSAAQMRATAEQAANLTRKYGR